MKKTIRELYNEVLKKAEEYGVEFNTFKRERFEDEFDDTIDSLLGNTDWSFNAEISLEDYENILCGYEEEFEAEKREEKWVVELLAKQENLLLKGVDVMHYDLDVNMYIDFINMDVTFLHNNDSCRATFNSVEELMGAIKEYILSCIKENEKEASPKLKAKYQKLLKELEK